MSGGSAVSALPRHGPQGRIMATSTPSKLGRIQPGTPPEHTLHHFQHHNPGRMMNLMFDPRVIRGPTHPYHPRKPEPSVHEHTAMKKVPNRKAKLARTALVTYSEPCTTRKDLDVQTDAYLEEYVEKVSEYDMDTQTDPFLDRPTTPLFIPQKSGPDAGTQIEEGDLFDFDEEVEPMLEVLAGRTLEQSIMEVMEEKELSKLRAYQTEAQMYVKGYMKDMTDSIFRVLQKLNYFYDPVEREVEELYFPFLSSEISKELKNIAVARSTLKCMVDQIASSSEERNCSAVEKTMDSLLTRVQKNYVEGASSVKGLVDNLITKIDEKAIPP